MNKNHIEVKYPPEGPGPNLNKDVIKFGVTTPLRENDKSGGELIELDTREPLSHAIQIACSRWGFTEPHLFALRFSEPPRHYVTEATRKEMSGKLVTMTYSPAKVCSDIFEKLKDSVTMTVGLKELALQALDPNFADVFVNEDGLTILLELIENDKLGEKENAYQFAFQSLLDIMFNSNSVSWDRIHGPILSRVLTYINSPKGPTQDRLGLKYALQVLENTVSSGVGYEQIDKEVTLPSLITLMNSQDKDVQQNVISFVNALLMKAESSRRKHLAATLNSRQYRTMILNNVINRPGERPAETNHQLYVLQTLLLNFLDERKLTPVDPGDPAITAKIADLCRLAFDSDGTFANGPANGDSGKRLYSRDYRKLGFRNEVNAAQDFTVVPPGVLALDCMYYLAHSHTDLYNKLVIECAYRGPGDDFLLPFARASISLTNLLCDLLRIGEPPGDQQGKFYPFFFQHEKPFEELFCICIQLLTKTWKEMRATMEDFDKVFDVVREQIRRSLDTTPQTFAAFQERLNSLTFAEITRLRTQERSSREEGELQAKPIQELRNKLTPDIKSLIRQNRINFLISGTRFNRFASKGLRVKEKFWYCRLSPNEKTFHYGDCEEKSSPMPEALPHKLSVIDIKGLLIGKDCPHIKESKKNRNHQIAFSIIKERDPLDTIDFIAPDERTFDLWTDGINALLGKDMMSKEAQEDLEILLHMEIKLRLLDIEGIEIPQEAPPIPPPPPNYNFGTYVCTK